MISEIAFEAAGARHTMRLGTRAMQEIERFAGVSCIKLLTQLSEDPENVLTTDLLIKFFSAGLNGGKGVENDVAIDVIDDLGGLLGGAMTVLNEAIVKAVPAPDGDKGEAKSGGNGKPKAA